MKFCRLFDWSSKQLCNIIGYLDCGFGFAPNQSYCINIFENQSTETAKFQVTTVSSRCLACHHQDTDMGEEWNFISIPEQLACTLPTEALSYFDISLGCFAILIFWD